MLIQVVGRIKKKMKEEFRLSEKRKEIFKILLKYLPTKAGRIYRIIKQQDKEFIKKLKNLFLKKFKNRDSINSIEIMQEIDTLAGENLK